MIYHHYEHNIPEIILNRTGEIHLENKSKISLRFEVDYNLMLEEQLEKIKNGNELEFAISTKCITYNGKENYKMENSTYIPAEDTEHIKYYVPVKTENNSVNFRMIKKNIEIYKDGVIVMRTEINHSKIIDLSLADGVYDVTCNVYSIQDELITSGSLKLHLDTNYYKINNSSNDKKSIIEFGENEGNFNIVLSTNSKRLYSFKVSDIVSENDNIFEFSFYNSKGADKNINGKIGAELNLLNDKEIEEIIKNPVQEQLVKPKFVFDIKELFTTKRSNSDIGVIRFPTIREKIKDNQLPYYNLRCDVTQNYSVDFEKQDDLLVTDKFKNYPLFYKFLIDTSFGSLRIIDSDNNEILDYVVEEINKDIFIVYFNPLRNKEYYYILDNDPPLHIRYKKCIGSYKMIFNKELHNNNKLEFEYPMYFGDLMLKGNGTYDVEIQFSDYNRKTFSLKAVDKEFEFLEDERIKIDREILSLKIKTKDKVEVISMICNFKNNRLNYSFFKNNFKDFVYIANSVGEINIDDIPETELSKFNINKKYIFKNNSIEEVQNGPLYLETINKTDIVFSDIEEWLRKYNIEDTEIIETSYKDKFFLENVTNPVREIRYEDK